MGATYERATWLAAQLRGADLRATADVRNAVVNLPCVLVVPPARDFRAKLVTWRLVVLGHGPGTAASWEAIDDQLDKLAAELPIESAEAGLYQLPNGDPGGVACYIATFTESL